jgi:two-component system cell cycle response regulator DivK
LLSGRDNGTITVTKSPQPKLVLLFPAFFPDGQLTRDFMRKDLTIMVVEDYDDTRVLLRKSLETLGYSVVEASNGQEAVDIADRARPDLILMDLDLPILDGIAATQCIRQKPELTSVPIVALTAYPMSYSHVKAFAKGCDEYMRKPIDMTELERIVARYLPTI